MTREFHRTVVCPNCGTRPPAEDAFNQWVRRHPELASSAGFLVTDVDLVLHQYRDMTDQCGDRTVQLLMFVEVKTNGAAPSPSQDDTLHVFGQVLRNQVPN